MVSMVCWELKNPRKYVNGLHLAGIYGGQTIRLLGAAPGAGFMNVTELDLAPDQYSL
jgi:hypothetical protein